MNDDNRIESSTEAAEPRLGEVASQREPYTPPVIEKFPPMNNVTFGTNIQPTQAQVIFGA